MKAIAKVDQFTFDHIWNDVPRFVGLHGPDVTGRDIEIRTPGYKKYITGLATDYEDGVITIEIFTKVN